MDRHELSPAPGSTHRRKVVGRGIGSGHGKTATRGYKGNKARGQVNPNFEGGQTPLHRRLPQLRGFKPRNKVNYAVVNLGDICTIEDVTEITPEVLFAAGFLRDASELVKVLGDGEITHPVKISAHKFSKAALAKLEAVGGTAEEL